MSTIIETTVIRQATNKDRDALKTLISGVLIEYGLKIDLDNTDSDLADIESNYNNRKGTFDLLTENTGRIMATVGIYKIDSSTCELRKMYLLKSERGKGYGRLLLEHALAKAKQLGYKKVILETASVLKEALGLYKKFGFVPYNSEHLSSRCDQAYYLEI